MFCKLRSECERTVRGQDSERTKPALQVAEERTRRAHCPRPSAGFVSDWHPQQESNPYQQYRKLLFYPLNYGGVTRVILPHISAVDLAAIDFYSNLGITGLHQEPFDRDKTPVNLFSFAGCEETSAESREGIS